MLKNHSCYLFKIYWILCLFLLTWGELTAQGIIDYSPVLQQISNFESAKDPKCHATASRLEDFVYGTPLSVEAREKRINFQQNLVEQIWLDYSHLIEKQAIQQNNLEGFQQFVYSFLKYKQGDGIKVYFKNGKEVHITARDYRQYSSVAYALRAILSIQQSYLFKAETLVKLDEAQITLFKKTIDIAVLALLNQADQYARQANRTQIKAIDMEKAMQDLMLQDLKKEAISTSENEVNPTGQIKLLNQIIQQKLTAYQAYNKISQAIFLRNIQVYFSKVLWPADTKKSTELKNFYTEAMVQFYHRYLRLCTYFGFTTRKKQYSIQRSLSSCPSVSAP